MIFLFLFLSLFSFASTAENNSAYFKLHQATGFFEQYVAGNCPLGKGRALTLLKPLGSQKVDVEIKKRVNDLATKTSDKGSLQVTDLESFRLSIHQVQERLGLHHEEHWHNDLLKECKGNVAGLPASTKPSTSDNMTFPKFECTAIEIFERSKASRILGSDQYPSASLRMTKSDRWIFSRNGEQIELGKGGVIEEFDPVTTKTLYRIKNQQSSLSFELSGTPPSRQGFLWEERSPPEKSIRLARITCH